MNTVLGLGRLGRAMFKILRARKKTRRQWPVLRSSISITSGNTPAGFVRVSN